MKYFLITPNERGILENGRIYQEIEERKQELKDAKYEMRHPINKGTMDGDYWIGRVSELEIELEELKSKIKEK